MPPPVGSLTVAEIATRVKRAFGDEAGAQINDTDILRWVNDAMKDIAINNDLLQVKATSDALIGVSEYHIPLDMLTLRSVKFKGSLLKPMSIQEANEYANGHDTTAEEPTGTPTHYWLWSNTINLYPTPDRDEYGQLMLYYTRQPAVLTLTTEVPEIAPQYHTRLVEYCLAQAYELDADMESYKMKMQQFQDGMDRLKDNSERTQHDFYPSITVMTGDTDSWDVGYYG